MNNAEQFDKRVTNGTAFGFYLMKELPLAWFAGLRVSEISTQKAVVSIPYGYRTKNPFQSVYFAAQAMAAELSTGILALRAVRLAPKPVSMLVFEMEAGFSKKARTQLRFVCNDGQKIADAVQRSIETGEGQTVKVKSTGIDAEGDTVSDFTFVWTFKAKSK